MKWLRSHRRTALLVGLTLLLPVALYLQTLFGLLGLAFDYGSQANRLEPRLERLQGLEAFAGPLEEQQSLALERLNALVYPPDQDASALAAVLQAEARALLSQAGMAISNSQVLPVRQDEMFDRIAVKLTVAGSLRALDEALIAIASAQPSIIVETMDAFPARASRRSDGESEQSLTAVLQLMVLRALP